MKTIFKFPILTDSGVVDSLNLPDGARVLSVAEQENTIVLYSLVETDNKTSKRVSIRVVGTGHEVPFDLEFFKFLGTVSLYGGSLMFHVYYWDHEYSGVLHEGG